MDTRTIPLPAGVVEVTASGTKVLINTKAIAKVAPTSQGGTSIFILGNEGNVGSTLPYEEVIKRILVAQQPAGPESSAA
ncbi:hypothetical protein [Hymenobacter terricola]|uniref:hypothetical protein n=1 Tax=Hymenobacter terricola TaxID=2819236 RepID=UPI001B3067CD|nr:hypothetical protein [Hymenobacter terricola]